MKKININEIKFDFHNILVAITTEPDYEMSRHILLDYYYYSNKIDKDVDFVIIDGYHCSCYGFDDTQWDAVGYTKKELSDLANAIYNKDDKFWVMVREHL